MDPKCAREKNRSGKRIRHVKVCAWVRDVISPANHLKVLVTTIDAQWEGMGDVGSARYEPALHPPCPTIRVLSYSN